MHLVSPFNLPVASLHAATLRGACRCVDRDLRKEDGFNHLIRCNRESGRSTDFITVHVFLFQLPVEGQCTLLLSKQGVHINTGEKLLEVAAHGENQLF